MACFENKNMVVNCFCSCYYAVYPAVIDIRRVAKVTDTFVNIDN